MQKVKIIILAGGKGTRMNHDFPKVLVNLKGKPMIKHLLESVKKSEICPKPCIVVGYGKELVMQELGNEYDYAIQEQQLGTGHAVLCAEEYVKDSESVLVLYGDNPYMTSETMKRLVSEHLKFKNKITMATVELPDFKDWREFFYKNFSRIIRDANGKILKSVEFKDATEKERSILEVNPCYFCFDTKWLFEKLKTLKNNNTQKEYYLTDLVKIAEDEKENLESIKIDPKEALAVNSQEELEILEKFIA